MTCPLCQRELIPGTIDDHHLIPKLKGGRKGPVVTLHKVCHQFIHATFSENELARTYNTIEALLTHEAVQKFVAWIKKKPANFYDPPKEQNSKKRRRR